MNYKDSKQHCIVCNRQGVDLHHVKTRGSGGKDDYWNLMPLCRCHHTIVHNIGLNSFARKHTNVRDWLEGQDWIWESYEMKWRHYD